MTYNFIKEIEAAYLKPENKIKIERIKRLKNIN